MPRSHFGLWVYCDICKCRWQCKIKGVSLINARKGHHRSRKHQAAQRARDAASNSSCNEMSQDENEEDIDFDMGGEDCDENRDVNTWEEMGLFPDGHDSDMDMEREEEEEQDKENEADDEGVDTADEDDDEDDGDVDDVARRTD